MAAIDPASNDPGEVAQAATGAFVDLFFVGNGNPTYDASGTKTAYAVSDVNKVADQATTPAGPSGWVDTATATQTG